MDRMKNVDLDFTDKIAENWMVTRIKYFCSMQSGDNIISEDIEDDGEYPVYGGNGLRGYCSEYTNDGQYVLIGRQGALCGNVHLVEGKFWASDHAVVTYPKNNIYNAFLYYLFTAMDLNKYSETAAQPGLSVKKILNIKTCIPVSFEEQVRIADVLDNKVSKINKVITVTKKEIEILELLKKATINESIVGGSYASAKRKSSGIDYIGAIPEHWDVKKLRFLGKLQNGITKAADDFGQGDPFVSYGNVYNNYQLPEAVEGLVESSLTEQDIYSVKRGDVFFTRTSETIEEIGFASTCLKDIEKAVYAGFVIRFRPKDDILLPEFSKYYFRSELHRGFFVKEMNIITRASLGQDLLKNLPVLIPPKDEQEEIANYLDKKCKAIDNIIEAKKKQIETLEAHKKTLIFDYVTGNKRVKEAI